MSEAEGEADPTSPMEEDDDVSTAALLGAPGGSDDDSDDYDPSASKGAAASAGGSDDDDDDDNDDDDDSDTGKSAGKSSKKNVVDDAEDDDDDDDSEDEPIVMSKKKSKKSKKNKNKRKKRTISDDEGEAGAAEVGSRPKGGGGWLLDEAEADDDDDDDDDEDGSAVEDLIDDTEIVERKKKKRKTRIDDDERELDKDDMELLMENLGDDAKMLQNKDYKRLKTKRTSDDGGSDEEEDEVQQQAPSLAFNDDPDPSAAPTYRTDGLDGSSSEDDWIVDDDETTEAKKKRKEAKKKNRARMTDQEKEAAEIFGTSALRLIGDAQDDRGSSDDDDDFEAKERRKVQKLRETYAPDEIERYFLTTKDDDIRLTDLPERVQQQFGDFRTRLPPSSDGHECRNEAEWIFDRVYSGDRVSGISDRILVRVLENRSRRDMLDPMTEVVRLLRWEESKRLGEDDVGQKEEIDCSGPREVPFIAQYRKELVQYPNILNMHDLWLIKEWDERWHKFQARKTELETSLHRVKWLQDRLAASIAQFAQANPITDDYSAALQAIECCRLVRGAKEVRTNNPPYFKSCLASGAPRSDQYLLAQLDGAASDGEESAIPAEETPVRDKEDGAASPAEMAAEIDADSVLDEEAASMSPSDKAGDSEEPVKEGSHSPKSPPAPYAPTSPPPPATEDMDVEGGVAIGEEEASSAGAAIDSPPSHMGSVVTSRKTVAPTADMVFERDEPLRTEDTVVKRRVTKTDVERIGAAATEDELNIIQEHLMMHMEDDFNLVQTYESDLLNWCNTVLQDYGAKVADFHRSWWDGGSLCMVVKACLTQKAMNSEDEVDDRVDIQEGEPVANLNEAKARARDELGITLDFDSVALVCCKNPHCGPRNKVLREIDDESGTVGFLCASCQPDALEIIRAATQLRDCHESYDEPESRQFGKGAKRVKRLRFTQYDWARRAGLLGMINSFGLTSEQFAGNLQMNFMQYEPQEPNELPDSIASQYISTRFKTEEDVLAVAQACAASQLAKDPAVYSTLKDIFLARATITVRPTTRGRKDIDDWHPFARYKFITNKWLRDLQDTDYLWIKKAVDEGQLEITIDALHDEATCSSLRIDPVDMFWERLQKCYLTDFTSSDAGSAWNEVRRVVLREAVTTLLFPRIEREIKATLMKEGLDAVLAKCGNHLRSKLFRAPFKSDRVGVDEGSGIQVVSIIPGDAAGKEQMPTYAVLLGPDGDMVDFLRLDWFMTSKRSIGAHAAKRAQDWDDLREFLHRNQPDAMVIGAIDLNSQRVHRDIVEWLAEAAQAADRGEEEPLPNIAVEYGEMQMARLFASSPRSLEEFPDHDIRVRQAISLARRFQNSEREFAAAFNQDNEILSIAWHPLQSMTRTEDLIRTLEQEVITAVNGAGVDLNLCLNHPASAAMLPFVAGFGPRKAAELLKQVTLAKRVEGGLVRIFTREHLMLYKEHIGSTVLWISSGFLYTPPDEQGGNDLDRTRVHPESYRYAMKIAKDARGELPTQVEGETEDGGVEAVQSIMEDPGNALDNIDLRVFAHELEKQGHGDKLQTLTDIVRELQAPSKDTRLEYKPLNSLQLFMHLTGETVLTLAPSMGVGMRRDTHPSLADLGFDPHEVFAHGPGANELFFYDHIEEMPSLMPNMLVACQVTRLAYKENDDGPKSVGFSCRIVDSEIQGFVPIMEISDDHTEDAAERVEPDMIVQARILQFNIERFSVRLSTKSSVLRGEGLTYVDWAWDPDFDTAAFVSDREALESKQAKANKYSRRRIDHPAYHNVTFGGAVKLLAGMPSGEVVIRPSSKGVNHITVSYKVTGSAVAHIDVSEEEKRARDEFSLGKKLVIGKEHFESLDELLATYVNPLTDFSKSLCAHKYFREGCGKAESDEQLRKEKEANPHRNPYLMWYDEQKSTFRISYMPGRSIRCERIVIGTEGYKYRDRKFQTIDKLISWFKVHFAEPQQRQPSMGGARQPSRLGYSSGPPAAAAAARGYGAPMAPPGAPPPGMHGGYGGPSGGMHPGGARGYGQIPPRGMPPGMPQYQGDRPPIRMPHHMQGRF